MWQRRIWCSPTVSFKDKPKCSPNKVNTIYIFHCLCSWSGPLAVYNWPSFMYLHTWTIVSYPFLILSVKLGNFLKWISKLITCKCFWTPWQFLCSGKRAVEEKEVFVAEKQYSFLPKTPRTIFTSLSKPATTLALFPQHRCLCWSDSLISQY